MFPRVNTVLQKSLETTTIMIIKLEGEHEENTISQWSSAKQRSAIWNTWYEDMKCINLLIKKLSWKDNPWIWLLFS